ncbi:zinc finger protein [Saccharopolyspora rosea]|uniref:Zinc finger protein n=1 Tax=Saccharopolyspora rosea TaxID=524884 RepID=A0ABW3G4U0_9PSEU|nr:zinc finger protein [Saccharopolyspora rosea]
MHPFHWVPAAGERHASQDARPYGGYPEGRQVTTLCGQQLPAAVGDSPWLWGTCPTCNDRAHDLAGVPTPVRRG